MSTTKIVPNTTAIAMTWIDSTIGIALTELRIHSPIGEVSICWTILVKSMDCRPESADAGRQRKRAPYFDVVRDRPAEEDDREPQADGRDRAGLRPCGELELVMLGHRSRGERAPEGVRGDDADVAKPRLQPERETRELANRLGDDEQRTGHGHHDEPAPDPRRESTPHVTERLIDPHELEHAQRDHQDRDEYDADHQDVDRLDDRDRPAYRLKRNADRRGLQPLGKLDHCYGLASPPVIPSASDRE